MGGSAIFGIKLLLLPLAVVYLLQSFGFYRASALDLGYTTNGVPFNEGVNIIPALETQLNRILADLEHDGQDNIVDKILADPLLYRLRISTKLSLLDSAVNERRDKEKLLQQKISKVIEDARATPSIQAYVEYLLALEAFVVHLVDGKNIVHKDDFDDFFSSFKKDMDVGNKDAVSYSFTEGNKSVFESIETEAEEVRKLSLKLDTLHDSISNLLDTAEDPILNIGSRKLIGAEDRRPLKCSLFPGGCDQNESSADTEPLSIEEQIARAKFPFSAAAIPSPLQLRFDLYFPEISAERHYVVFEGDSSSIRRKYSTIALLMDELLASMEVVDTSIAGFEDMNLFDEVQSNILLPGINKILTPGGILSGFLPFSNGKKKDITGEGKGILIGSFGERLGFKNGTDGEYRLFNIPKDILKDPLGKLGPLGEVLGKGGILWVPEGVIGGAKNILGLPANILNRDPSNSVVEDILGFDFGFKEPKSSSGDDAAQDIQGTQVDSAHRMLRNQSRKNQDGKNIFPILKSNSASNEFDGVTITDAYEYDIYKKIEYLLSEHFYSLGLLSAKRFPKISEKKAENSILDARIDAIEKIKKDAKDNVEAAKGMTPEEVKTYFSLDDESFHLVETLMEIAGRSDLKGARDDGKEAAGDYSKILVENFEEDLESFTSTKNTDKYKKKYERNVDSMLDTYVKEIIPRK